MMSRAKTVKQELAGVEHVTLRDYESLARWGRMLPQRDWKLIILLGNPGLGKSRTVREALRTRFDAEDANKLLWINGRTTPVRLYAGLYALREGGVLVLNDSKSLLKDLQATELIMAATESEEAPEVIWDSSRAPKSQLYNNQGDIRFEHGNAETVIPKKFRSRAKVVIIGNDLKILGDRLDAAIDRGFVLHCDFSAATVHAKAGEWFPAQAGHAGGEGHAGRVAMATEIYQFIGNCLPLIKEPSFRYYTKALDIATTAEFSGLEWKMILLDLWGVRPALLNAIALKFDRTIPSDLARLRKFEEATGLKRTTYYELVGHLENLHLIGDDERDAYVAFIKELASFFGSRTLSVATPDLETQVQAAGPAVTGP